MENKSKKLQLKKETIALLNDPNMRNVNGGGLPGGGGVPGVPGQESGGIGCRTGALDTNCGTKTAFQTCQYCSNMTC